MSKRIGYPRVSTNTKGKKKDNKVCNGNTLEAQEEKL